MPGTHNEFKNRPENKGVKRGGGHRIPHTFGENARSVQGGKRSK